ncbi:5-formyltetrahydrofolate cyclo-ligase [Bacillus testis]|uniref:5-formyltetrahydrofolate cyclo-ligase n=1 Tax=Bacillus testis TaxID=1622072 RepID=UPI00067E9404|nr:5-formyltetrahydrofolate cyclo-ligase [Bacillus testis]
MDKKSIRQEAIKKLNEIQHHIRQEQSKQIAQQLYGTNIWKEAKTIGITVSTKIEIDTTALIEQAWKEGKKVAVPKCNPVDHTMTFRFLTNFKELETVYQGLLEPIKEQTLEATPSELDLIVVPGVAFAKNGYRIGYGGGYYDRFLEGYNGKTVALATPLQIYASLPNEPYDIPVQMLVTPEEVLILDAEL